MRIALVWFRNDLRLADNPALQAALHRGYAPVPVYVHAPHEEGAQAPGAASDAWRARSLQALDADLRTRGSRLLCLQGDSADTLLRLASRLGAQAVFWNRRYEPAVEARDTRLKRRLREAGLQAQSFNAALLAEPWDVATKAGDPYRVFTAYWKTAQATRAPLRTTPAPERLPPVDGVPADGFDPATLLPAIGWDAGFRETGEPGEAGASRRLQAFVEGALADYPKGRDLPAIDGTSRLSPPLHFGELSVQRAVLAAEASAAPREAVAAFVRELGWREFAHHLLHHYPHTVERNLDVRFDAFAWATPEAGTLRAWQQGRTGIPIVDAGMRQLWHTGWMHNRVRMLVASLLCKNLRVHWTVGARWFHDTLVDADLACNTLGWQWVAGTGADAAPYFRVFNPALQARRFDPDGAYLRRWVPELAALPTRALFEPWKDAALLRRCAPGYPSTPVVDLAASREAALAGWRALRGAG